MYIVDEESMTHAQKQHHGMVTSVPGFCLGKAHWQGQNAQKALCVHMSTLVALS